MQKSLRFICSFFFGCRDDNLQFFRNFGRKFPANLYTTTSMNGGYKANVNFGDYTARRYCIKRNIGYDNIGSESDTTFDF